MYLVEDEGQLVGAYLPSKALDFVSGPLPCSLICNANTLGRCFVCTYNHMEPDRRRTRLEQKRQSLKVYLSDNKNKTKQKKTLQRRNPGSLPGSWQKSWRCKIQLPACAFLLMLWWPERAMPEIRLSRLVIPPKCKIQLPVSVFLPSSKFVRCGFRKSHA